MRRGQRETSDDVFSVLAIIAITDVIASVHLGRGEAEKASVRRCGRVWVEKPELFMKCSTGRGAAVGPPIWCSYFVVCSRPRNTELEKRDTCARRPCLARLPPHGIRRVSRRRRRAATWVRNPTRMHTRCLIYIYICTIFVEHLWKMSIEWKCIEENCWCKILNVENFTRRNIWSRMDHDLLFCTSNRSVCLPGFCPRQVFVWALKKKERKVCRKLYHGYVDTLYMRGSKSWSWTMWGCSAAP